MTLNLLLATISHGISFEPMMCQDLQPLPGDPWVVVSALQKAIRRGETETAERAAISVLRYRGDGLFRRLIIIAFEDIGIGAPDLLVQTTRLCSDAKLRRTIGEPELVGRALVRALAAAPKDRSADYLICSATYRADWEHHRQAAGRSDISDRIAMARDNDLSLPARVTSAWYASGLESGREHRFAASDLKALMRGFAESGLADDMVEAVHVAAKLTKEPIVLMLPPLLQELNRNEGKAFPERFTVPEARYTADIPLFALDKHTRSGRLAIGTFARENRAVRQTLERHVPEFRHRNAAMIAAFYADAMPVSLRLSWDRANELEALGTETDLAWAGIPPEGMEEILLAVRSNIDHLNEIRSRLLQGNSADKAART